MNINQLKKIDLQNDEDLQSFINYMQKIEYCPGPASISNFIVELCFDEQSKGKTFLAYLLTTSALSKSIDSNTFYSKWTNGKFAKALINGLTILAKSLANKTFEFYNHIIHTLDQFFHLMLLMI